MAGMLPGVESARRRRFHSGGSLDSSGGSRRSSFGLYTMSHESHHLSTNSTRNALNKGFHGGALGNIAREAKERLDERLRSQQASMEIKRHNSTGSMRRDGGHDQDESSSCRKHGNLQREVFCAKRSMGKQLMSGWRSKMGWKAAEQPECAVCLEEFKTGDILVHLPCAHRFHWSCVLPWLESSSQCPCCRMSTLCNSSNCREK